MAKPFSSFSKFAIFDDYRESSLSLLLLLQILMIFIVAPVIDSSHGQHRWVLDTLIALMAFVSTFIVKDKIRRRLAVFSFILCLIGFGLGPFLSNQIVSKLVVSASEIIFSLNVCWIVITKIFASGPITTHRIRGAVVLYLNIAILFGVIDSVLASLIPGAYANLPKDNYDTIGSMVYFSLITLTTTGYGDLTPVHPFARSLAELEAVIGQFYMGTLIASLIGLHVSTRHEKHKNG
jgi:hypothetical protein